MYRGTRNRFLTRFFRVSVRRYLGGMMTEHPDPVLQQRQREALASMPDDQRDFLARMFRFGNLSYRYYQRPEAEPTEEDFEEWLEGLPPNIAEAERKCGFAECRRAFPLRRYAL